MARSDHRDAGGRRRDGVPGGGSLPAGTYYYKVAARVSAGQTNKANSTAVRRGVGDDRDRTTGGVTISWTPVVGAEDYLVYGRAAGAENMYWKTTNPYLTDTGGAGTAGTPAKATKWAVKNTFELKNAQDVLIEGNVFENIWVADQTGYPIVITPRNQGGQAPWAITQRITFQYNLIRHAAGGVNILGTDDLAPSQRTNNVTVRHNVLRRSHGRDLGRRLEADHDRRRSRRRDGGPQHHHHDRHQRRLALWRHRHVARPDHQRGHHQQRHARTTPTGSRARTSATA